MMNTLVRKEERRKAIPCLQIPLPMDAGVCNTVALLLLLVPITFTCQKSKGNRRKTRLKPLLAVFFFYQCFVSFHRPLRDCARSTISFPFSSFFRNPRIPGP